MKINDIYKIMNDVVEDYPVAVGIIDDKVVFWNQAESLLITVDILFRVRREDSAFIFFVWGRVTGDVIAASLTDEVLW